MTRAPVRLPTELVPQAVKTLGFRVIGYGHPLSYHHDEDVTTAFLYLVLVGELTAPLPPCLRCVLFIARPPTSALTDRWEDYFLCMGVGTESLSAYRSCTPPQFEHRRLGTRSD